MLYVEELNPEQLRRTVDPKELDINSTENKEKLEGIIGQERAVSALQFGLGIQETGFNIYVAGPPGIGKMTAVKAFLEKQAAKRQTPSDWCYVNNFDDPYQPRALRLPAGMGRNLQQDMKALIEHFRREIPKAFESEEYAARRDEVFRKLDEERIHIVNELNERAARAGFLLQATPLGVLVVPVVKEKPLTEAEFDKLPPNEKEEILKRRQAIEEEVKSAMKQVRMMEREAQEKVQNIDRQVSLFIVKGLMEDLIEKYGALPEVVNYLESVQEDIITNIDIFKATPDHRHTDAETAAWQKEIPFRKFQVNVLVDNGKQQGAPVVLELSPTYNNLFGRIQKETHLGALYTDFTMIKAGALHRANGGYLVVYIEELLRNLLSWEGIKRTLQSQEIQIEELGERFGFLATKSLRPQPIPLDVKVLVLGPPLLHQLLTIYDPDFRELFKVKAEFDTSMPFTRENIQNFIALIVTFCCERSLKHMDAGAIAKVLEYSLRVAEDQQKLSTHFGILTDLLREAHYWASQDGSRLVSASHVKKALEEKVYRSNLLEERVREMIARRTLLIDTAGEKVGQVNGLSVITLGDYEFGRPSRITASVGPGREGIIDIEREVKLGGPIHSKGVLILSGFLSQRFARNIPLALAARLVFEQSYSGVEGDSASAAEAYALLSEISGIPIKQGIAVTGSINQKGEVQAVGGVNQKIEGFYDVCKVKGLTGEQGVIIPFSNVTNLMLREDVVEAVRSKKFHVWAVDTIDEGMEILTGRPAGQRDEAGKFPERSVNDLVEKQLRSFARCIRELSPAAQEPKGSE